MNINNLFKNATGAKKPTPTPYQKGTDKVKRLAAAKAKFEAEQAAKKAEILSKKTDYNILEAANNASIDCKNYYNSSIKYVNGIKNMINSVPYVKSDISELNGNIAVEGGNIWNVINLCSQIQQIYPKCKLARDEAYDIYNKNENNEVYYSLKEASDAAISLSKKAKDFYVQIPYYISHLAIISGLDISFFQK